MQSFDVVIVGGGMVGLTLAAALEGKGLSIAVIESQSLSELTAYPEPRVSALNHASRTLLQRLGVWSYLDADRLQPYQGMQVWEKDSFAKIDFSAVALMQADLGVIVENHALVHALVERLQAASDVTLRYGDPIRSLSVGVGGSFILSEAGVPMTAKLLVAADGAHSFVRDTLEVPLTQWDYDHHGLIATIRTERAHQQIARQVFNAPEILAFLPLAQTDLCSIVWSLPPERAAELMQCSAKVFNQQLAVAFDMRLGQCKLEGERQSFPLKMRYARVFAGDHFALIGDAAHTIHPLAGQGVNLGLMDAAALAEVLQRPLKVGCEFGSHQQLRAYERWRKSEALKMISLMEGFKRLFGVRHPLIQLIRDLGMSTTDRLDGLKASLMRSAMGLEGDLPQMAKRFVD